MRKYAILEEPIKCNEKDFIFKIMLYQSKKEVLLFEYCSMDANQCSFDVWYPDVESVYEDWDDKIDERGWIDIDDPLPDCQQDAFASIRVKGRNLGNPKWGQLEILKDGKWVEYSL
ncbi:MAG: hypothetical protein OSJ73_12395 [Lachnospiraceae bacterium]|nr:hypothetical protein [Lachnospiraceae bacterium]